MFSKLRAYGCIANQYDVIKAVALIAMTVDHIGWLFFPDETWLRAMGRIAFPLFFFLIGTHSDKPMRSDIWWWAVAYEVFTLAMGRGLFPLNVLFTIATTYSMVQWCERYKWIERQPLSLGMAILLFAFPTMVFLEFGTLGLGFAVLGVMWRLGLHQRSHRFYAGAMALGFITIQAVIYDFDIVSLKIAGLTLFILATHTKHFEPKHTYALATPIDATLRLLSRYALPYYVLHLIALQLIAIGVVGQWPAVAFSWFN